MKQKRKKFIILLFFLIILLCIMPIPIKINQSISGIELSPTDTNVNNSVKITIKGTFYWKIIKLLGQDKFKGNISIKKYPFTEEKILANNRSIKIIYNDSIPMIYYNKKNIFDIDSLGYIGTTWKFKHFAILVQTDPLNPTFIIAHANNQEEALHELKFLDKAFDGLVEYKQLKAK